MTKICADVVSGVYTVSEKDDEWKTANIFSDVDDFIDYALHYCKEEEIIGFEGENQEIEKIANVFGKIK